VTARRGAAAGLAAAAVTGLLLVAGSALAAAPVQRGAAAQEARRELSKGIYHTDEPGLLERGFAAAVRWLDRTLSRLAEHSPGGATGLLVLVAAVAALLWFAIWRAGPLRGASRRGPPATGVDPTLSARQHRQRAEEFAAAGAYAEAIRERMRAIVRELEVRGVLEPRPGRTAAEVAADAGGQVPAIGPPLRQAATVFDEVWYGGRPGTAGAYDTLREADEAVRRAPLAVAARAAG
jgi:hypothetical protein